MCALILVRLPVSCCRYAQLRFRPGFELGCFRPLGAFRFRYHASTLCQFTPTIPIEPDLPFLITYPFFVCLLFDYSARHEMLTDVSPLFALPYLGSTFVPFPSSRLPFLPIQRDTTRPTRYDASRYELGCAWFRRRFPIDARPRLQPFYPIVTCGSGTIAPTRCHSIDVDFDVIFIGSVR